MNRILKLRRTSKVETTDDADDADKQGLEDETGRKGNPFIIREIRGSYFPFFGFKVRDRRDARATLHPPGPLTG
jgi:hypothetical protein